MKIVFKGKDGSVAVMSLAPNADKGDAVRKFREAHPGEYLDHFEVDDKEIPLQREFRDAWTLINSKIVLDKAKAMTIHMGRVRHSRDKALEVLDKKHLRYLGNDAKLLEIEALKQELRDLPANVKGLDWPDILEK